MVDPISVWQEVSKFDWIKNSFENPIPIPGGKGGAGFVFTVSKKTTGEIFALKICKFFMLEEFNAFKREVNLQMQLDHPNIVKVFDFNFEIKEWKLNQIEAFFCFILMEKGGCSVEQMIKNAPTKMLDEATVLNILWCSIQGLLYAKRKICAHMDFKPDNILQFGQIFKICDWGCSIIGIPDETEKGDVKVVGVTRPYDDPELDFIDPKVRYHFCDIYAIGISLLHMFGINTTVLKRIKLQINDEAKYYTQIGDQINEAINNSKTTKPKQWKELLDKCVALHHKDRWALEDLEKHLLTFTNSFAPSPPPMVFASF